MTKPEDSVKLVPVEIRPHPEAVKAGLRAAALARTVPACPNCGKQVKPVTQRNSYLNSDQFDAIRAGDWYCTACPEDAGTAKKSCSGFAYFWDKDIAGVVENRVVGDYFNSKRQLAIMHDKLLEMFGISERNEFEIKDLRDRQWHVSDDGGNVSYIRFSVPSDGATTAARVVHESERRQGGLVLIKAGFDVGSPMYLLFKESNMVDKL